jgi:hypothetical protein
MAVSWYHCAADLAAAQSFWRASGAQVQSAQLANAVKETHPPLLDGLSSGAPAALPLDADA